jgi:peptide/nickel transport system permease protein
VFNYIIRRLLATIPVMLVVALVVFGMLFFSPGDPAAVIAGDQATPADVERIREALGLNRPPWEQFGIWLWNVLQFDLGRSIFTGLPVTTMIAQRIEPTLMLCLFTLVIAVSIAVPLGVVAAWRATQPADRSIWAGVMFVAAALLVAGGILADRGTLDLGESPIGEYSGWTPLALAAALPLVFVGAWKSGALLDRLVMVMAVFGFSVPVFVVGYVLAYFFALEWDLLPVQGYQPLRNGFWGTVESLTLPAIALGGVYIALIARITRATMLEVLAQDYVRTAKAKGLGQRAVLFLHALKNAAVPIVTVIGIGVALLIGGAVVTESVFALPGVGRLVVDAILRRDYPVIQGVILLFSFTYVLVNLAVDLLYTLFDPRIRY